MSFIFCHNTKKIKFTLSTVSRCSVQYCQPQVHCCTADPQKPPHSHPVRWKLYPHPPTPSPPPASPTAAVLFVSLSLATLESSGMWNHAASVFLWLACFTWSPWTQVQLCCGVCPGCPLCTGWVIFPGMDRLYFLYPPSTDGPSGCFHLFLGYCE